MYSTTWDVNGKHIELSCEFVGDIPAPFDSGNTNRNIIAVAVDGTSDTFDAWGSYVHPEFDDEYSLKNIFQVICGDALNVVWDQLDEVVEMYDDAKEAWRVATAMQEEAAKIEALGLDEDDLEKIVNDDEWH